MIDGGAAGNPFPGLRPFEAGEGHLFFGREQQIDELLGRMRLRRFVAVVGTSGSGKSSLVRAGLFPALRVGAMSGAGSRWRIVMVHPGNDPLGIMARELEHEQLLGDDGDPQLRIDLAHAVLDRGGLGLVEIFRQAKLGPNENLLVVVDQFEELFRYSQLDADAAAAFVKLLLAATAYPDLPLYVVVTMRSDFLGDCAAFPELPERINDGLFLIPRMDRAQLERAIVGPVRVAEGKIAPRLVNRLVNEVGDDPDQLPVLQHALMRTWEIWKSRRAPDEPLDVTDYEATGGLKRALDLHAQSIYDALSPPDRDVARRLFSAITELGSDNRGIRRPVELGVARSITGASDAELRRVIEAFRAPGRSLLTPRAADELTDRSVVDISHESLMRVWVLLDAWLKDEAESAQTYRRLAQDALLHAQGRAALWTDPSLALAEKWRSERHPNAAWAERYVKGAFSPAMAFLDAGISARERQLNEANLRREAEAAAERKQLEQQAAIERMRADAARVVASRTRILALCMSAIALVAVILGGLSWHLRAVAESSLAQLQTTEHQLTATLSVAESQREKAVQAERTTKIALDQAQRAHLETKRALTTTKRALADAERARILAQYQHDRAKKAVVASTRTANDIVSDVAEKFRDRGIPVDVTRKILDRTNQMQQQLIGLGETSPDLLRSEYAALAELSTTLLAQGDTKAAFTAATHARDIMEGLVASNPRNDGWQRDLSASYRGFGDVLAAQGNQREALTYYRRALAIVERLLKTDPANLTSEHDLSESYEKAGDALAAQGNLREAMRSYSDGLAIRERLAKAQPQRSAWQRDLAASYGKMGDVQSARANTRVALGYYREDLTIVQRLAIAEPANATWQRDLAASYGRLGGLLAARGNLNQAAEYYRRDFETIQTLAKTDPGNASWQRELSASYNNIGSVMSTEGNVPEALTSYRGSLAITERLAGADRGNAIAQRDLAGSYDNVGAVLATQGDLSTALRYFRTSLALREHLAKSEPGDASRRLGLSVSYNNVAYVLQTQGLLPLATTYYRNGLAIRERLAASDPGNAIWQADRANAYDRVGRVLMAHGEPADMVQALKYYRDSLAIRERLASADPGNMIVQHAVSVSYNEVGGVLDAQGGAQNLSLALDYFRKDLAIAERLAKSDPGNALLQRELSVSYDTFGDVLKEQHDAAGALKAYREAVTIVENLAKTFPQNLSWQADLAHAYLNVGDALKDQETLTEAETYYRKELAIAERLAQTDRGNMDWKSDLAASYNRVGNLLFEENKPADSVSYYRSALALYEDLAKVDPGSAGRQFDLVISLKNLGGSGDDPLGHYTRALEIARRLKAEGKLIGKEQNDVIGDLETRLANLPK
jgi:tetratricopeptide (TPR) repeat protein